MLLLRNIYTLPSQIELYRDDRTYFMNKFFQTQVPPKGPPYAVVPEGQLVTHSVLWR